MMQKYLGAFPTQSEIGSVTEQLPKERLQDFVRGLMPMVESKEDAALAMYRERPSEIGRRRLLEMGIEVESIRSDTAGSASEQDVETEAEGERYGELRRLRALRGFKVPQDRTKTSS
jgi:hypothetical protein